VTPTLRVAVAADHNGVELKAHLAAWLEAHGHEVHDLGARGHEMVDYPPLCSVVCREVVEGRADRGIVVGGSGMGEVMACNKVRGIRAGLCHDVFTTRISRANNDSNVMAIGSKVIEPEMAERLLEVWTTTEFAGGRHQQRLEQIAALERGEWL
jgi:ribose 5-phosphate isomerase B